MKYRITAPGWEGFTGMAGQFEFADGISVEDISRVDASRMACVLALESVEENPKDPSPAQAILDSYYHEVTTVTLPSAADMPETIKVGKIYTSEELAVVADTGGIKAIRAIADEFTGKNPDALRGRSIAELIGKILEAQKSVSSIGSTDVGNAEPAPAPVAEVVLDLPAQPAAEPEPVAEPAAEVPPAAE